MTDRFEPRIVGFLCNWCSYAGADLAGTSRLSYAPNIRIIRVPCSGRVDPLFVLRALRDGADGVMVLGCHPGDCHYGDGNYHARRRFVVMQELLSFIGYEPERVRVDWVSASEGARFARVVNEFTEAVRALGPVRRYPAAQPPVLEPVPDAPERRSAAAPEPDPDAPERGPAAALDPEQTQQLRELAARLLAQRDRPRSEDFSPQSSEDFSPQGSEDFPPGGGLRSPQVGLVIGWEQGATGVRPLFATTAEQAARLVVPRDPGAGLNLVTYLHRAQSALQDKRIAVVVRPADARSLNVLIREGRLRREDVILIGLWGESDAEALPASACDTVLSGPAVAPPVRSPTLDEVESWPIARRAAFWTAQFSRCDRCYACRQACPLCYCAECLSEQLNPAWQSIAIEAPEQEFFHVMRAFHLAGRCTGCDACSNACPEGVPLHLLNQKVARVMARFFGPDGAQGEGYRAGTSAEAALPFTVFSRNELTGGRA